MSAKEKLVKFKNAICDYLGAFEKMIFPEYRCFLCGREVRDTDKCLCDDCLKEFKLISGNICKRCGMPLPELNKICDDCKNIEYEFDVARAAFLYNRKTARLITDLKFRNRKYLARFLAICMSETLKTFPMDVDYIIPVPVSAQRLKSRGFNQAELIANHLSLLIGKPVVNDLIIRTNKETANQKDLSKLDRMKNLVGAFEVRRTKEFEGKDLLIVDDVFTTGATVNEVARMLRKLNPSGVCVITAGKTDYKSIAERRESALRKKHAHANSVIFGKEKRKKLR